VLQHGGDDIRTSYKRIVESFLELQDSKKTLADDLASTKEKNKGLWEKVFGDGGANKKLEEQARASPPA